MSVENLSPTELKSLINQAEQRLRETEAKHREQTRAELTDLAKAAGYDIRELFGFTSNAKPARVAKSRTSPTGLQNKYAHPSNASLTWVGRGKRPRWVNEYINDGGTIDQLLIKAA